MPTSYNDRTIQRILDHLTQLDDEFKVVLYANQPLYPPMLYGGSTAQRLSALEAWSAEWLAAPDEARQATASTREGHAAITAAIDELTKLRELGARDGAQG